MGLLAVVVAGFLGECAARLAVKGAPWALTETAKVVIIAAEPRSASTEASEAIRRHPCGTNFNEVLGLSERPPSEYTAYTRKTGIDLAGYANVTDEQLAERLQTRPDLVLETVHANYCRSRQRSVQEICGDVCVIAFKLHDKFPVNIPRLLKYADARTIVMERDPASRECSLVAARATRNWGHSPEQHVARGEPVSQSRVCPPTASENFAKKQRQYYATVREALNETTHMELPFLSYVTDTKDAQNHIRLFAGLLPFPSEFADACTDPWCKSQRWPFPLDG